MGLGETCMGTVLTWNKTGMHHMKHVRNLETMISNHHDTNNMIITFTQGKGVVRTQLCFVIYYSKLNANINFKKFGLHENL